MLNKKVLIVGSTGFVGVHLNQYLNPRVKELITFSRSKSTLKNNRHIIGDIRDENQIKKIIRLKPDIIFLLSSISGQTISDASADLSFATTVRANIALLDEVVKNLPKTKIIFSSSRLEYGKLKYLPVDENHPIAPLSYYGLHKSLVTQYCQFLSQKFGLDTVILRTSNPYGPLLNSQRYGYNVVSSFIQQSLMNKPLIIFGTGKQKRDYLFIDDFLEALFLCMKNKKTKGQIYNIGSGKGVSLKDVATEIVTQIGKGKIRYAKWPISEKRVETGDYISNISKFTLHTGWRPKTSIRGGVSLSLERMQAV